MQALSSSFTAVAVAAIYVVWRAYEQARLRKGCTVHERVAYMLWVAANLPE